VAISKPNKSSRACLSSVVPVKRTFSCSRSEAWRPWLTCAEKQLRNALKIHSPPSTFWARSTKSRATFRRTSACARPCKWWVRLFWRRTRTCTCSTSWCLMRNASWGKTWVPSSSRKWQSFKKNWTRRRTYVRSRWRITTPSAPRSNSQSASTMSRSKTTRPRWRATRAQCQTWKPNSKAKLKAKFKSNFKRPRTLKTSTTVPFRVSSTWPARLRQSLRNSTRLRTISATRLKRWQATRTQLSRIRTKLSCLRLRILTLRTRLISKSP